MFRWVKRCIALIVVLLAIEAQGKAVHFDKSLPRDTSDPDNLYFPQLWQAHGTTYCGGDRIFLKRGQIFIGTLKIALTPSCSGGEIQLSAEGNESDPKPIIRRSHNLPGNWEPVTNPRGPDETTTIEHLKGMPVYRIASADEVTQLIVNDEVMQVALWGGGETNNRGRNWQSIEESNELEDWIKLANWSLGKYGVGPNNHVYVRTSAWRAEPLHITGYDFSSNLLEYDTVPVDPSTTPAPPEVNNYRGRGAILTNHLAYLDSPGEWVYQNGYIYFWPEGNTLDTIESFSVSKPQHGIEANLRHSASLRIDDIDVHDAGRDGIRITGPRTLTIRNVEVLRSQNTGIAVYDLSNSGWADSISIVDNLINRSGSKGVSISGAAKIVFERNRVKNTGYLGGDSKPGSAVHLSRMFQLSFRNNVLQDVAYAGIQLGAVHRHPEDSSWGIDVANNTIKRYCQALDDCGAIYINGGGSSGSPFRANHYRIDSNAISDGYGNRGGLNDPDRSEARAPGIYLDHEASYIEVTNNYIGHASSWLGGIFLHGGTNNLVRGNRVRQWNYPAMGIARTDLNGDASLNNCFENNRLISRSTSPWPGNRIFATVQKMNWQVPGAHSCQDNVWHDLGHMPNNDYVNDAGVYFSRIGLRGSGDCGPPFGDQRVWTPPPYQGPTSWCARNWAPSP